MNTTLDIPTSLSERLRQAAQAQGQTWEEYALSTLDHAAPNGTAPDEPLPALPKHSNIQEFHAWLMALAESVPPQERGELPRDGARNHDHYLYGAPKVEQ